MLEHHPNSPFTELRRIPCCCFHDSILSRIGVSGKPGAVHFVQRRLACPQFVRQSFHEFAKSSILYSRWARAYYDQQRQRGNKYHEAVRALAYKWIRIIYQCWRQRAPYNEDVYLARLELHGSMLAKLISSDGRKSQELN